jgi:hypothetical protein
MFSALVRCTDTKLYLQTTEIIVSDISGRRTCVAYLELQTGLRRPVINTRPNLRHDASAMQQKKVGKEGEGRVKRESDKVTN